MALKQGKYEYLHLLSGCDLPLKDQDYIHGFFNSLKKGINLVGFAQGEFNKNDLAEKTDYYHFFIVNIDIHYDTSEGCLPSIEIQWYICKKQ